MLIALHWWCASYHTAPFIKVRTEGSCDRRCLSNNQRQLHFPTRLWIRRSVRIASSGPAHWRRETKCWRSLFSKHVKGGPRPFRTFHWRRWFPMPNALCMFLGKCSPLSCNRSAFLEVSNIVKVLPLGQKSVHEVIYISQNGAIRVLCNPLGETIGLCYKLLIRAVKRLCQFLGMSYKMVIQVALTNLNPLYLQPLRKLLSKCAIFSEKKWCLLTTRIVQKVVNRHFSETCCFGFSCWGWYCRYLHIRVFNRISSEEMTFNSEVSMDQWCFFYHRWGGHRTATYSGILASCHFGLKAPLSFEQC